jgi:hypothetical protein
VDQSAFSIKTISRSSLLPFTSGKYFFLVGTSYASLVNKNRNLGVRALIFDFHEWFLPISAQGLPAGRVAGLPAGRVAGLPAVSLEGYFW